MKKVFRIFLTFTSLAIANNECPAQFQSFRFANYAGGWDAPVFDASGNRLDGVHYLAALYSGATPDGLAIASDPVSFTARFNDQSGYFSGGVALVPVDSCVAVPWLQVRVWDARLGSTYEQVMALGVDGYGESNIFQKRGGDPGYCVTLPTPPEQLFGLESFSLVPEPTPSFLLLLGLPLLLLRRWRKRIV